MSQKAFWGFLAASQKNVQKMSGKCPGAGPGAGKMSKKCQKNVPQTFSRHFFDIFWPIESQKGARARAKRARPLLGGGRRPPPLYWPKNVKKMSGKCLGTFLGHFFDIFWTFFQRQPQHQDIFQTFFGHFSGRLPGSPKRHFGTFFDIFRGRPKIAKNVFWTFFWHFKGKSFCGASVRPGRLQIYRVFLKFLCRAPGHYSTSWLAIQTGAVPTAGYQQTPAGAQDPQHAIGW